MIVFVVTLQVILSVADGIRLTLVSGLCPQTGQLLTESVECMQKYALHFGSVPFMVHTLVADALAPFVGTLIQVQTQFFLLSRAHHFARLAYPIPGRDAVAILLAVLIVGSGACGCATAVWTKMLQSYSNLVPGKTAPEYYTVCLQVWLATSAGVDIILAGIITQ